MGSQSKSPQVHHTQIELDSHIDTIVLGKNAIVLSFTGKTCQVSPYNDTYKAITNVPVVTGATLWMDPGDGQEHILVFHEALYMGDTLEHSLINLNQLRSFGVIAQDNPFANAPLGIEDPSSGITIPLSTLGTAIYADTRSCTDDDLSCLPHIVLSSDAHWDPHGVGFPAHCSDREVASITMSHTCQQHDFNSNLKTDANIGSIYFNPFELASRLVTSIQVTGPNQEKQDIPSSKTFTSKERHNMVTPEDISNRWFIGLAQASKTIKHTTQRILRSAVLPLACRYKVDRMYEQPWLKCTIYTNAMNGRHKSLDRNKHAQVFATEQFFVASYLMESKSMSGQALKEFISDFGVPDCITCDRASE